MVSVAAAVLITSASMGGQAAAQSGFSSPFDTPPGSWRRSCMGGMVMSGELIANCQDSRGFLSSSPDQRRVLPRRRDHQR
jgi:hypothetical protein